MKIMKIPDRIATAASQLENVENLVGDSSAFVDDECRDELTMIVQSKTEEIENCREMVHRHLVGPFVSDARRRLDAACVSELLARLADGYQRLLSIEFAGLSAGDAEVILQLYDANKSQIGRIVRNMEELTRDCETVQMDSEDVQTSIILPVCIRNTCLIQCRLSTKRGLIPPRQLQVLDEYGIYTRKFYSSNLELRQRWFAQVRSVHRLFGTPWRANANTSHEETGLIYPEYFVSRSQPAEPLTVIEDRITQLKDYQKSLELNSGGFNTLVTLNAFIVPTCTPDGIELMEREIRDAYCQLTGRAAQSEKEILILKDLFFSVENIHREIASIRGLVFSTKEDRIFSYNQFKELRALVCYFQNYTRKRVTELESHRVQSEQHQIAPRLNDEGTRVELTIASSSAKSLVQIFDLARFWLIESYKSLEEELTQYENKIRTQMNHLKRLELSVKTETSGQRIRSHRRSKSLCNCTGLCDGGSVRRRYSTDSLCTLKEDKRILTAGLNALPISGFAPTDCVVSSWIHPYDFDRSLSVSPYLRCSSNFIDRNVSLIQSLETNSQLDVTNYDEICDNAACLVETFELQLARVLQMAANALNNECTPSESANSFNWEHVSEFLKNASKVIVCSLDHFDTEIGSATPSTVLKPLVDELKIMVQGSGLATPPRPALCSLSAPSTPMVKQADSVVPLEGPSPTWETSCCFVMSKSRGFQAPGQTNCEKQLSNGVAPAANVENVDVTETSNPSSGLLGFGLNSDYVKEVENSMLEGKACGSRLRTRLLQAHESLLESLKVFEEKMEETRRCCEKIAHCTTPDSPPSPPPVLDLTNIHYLIGVRSVQELSVDWTKNDGTCKLETVQKHLTLCWKNFNDLIARWEEDTCSEVLHHSRLPMDILWDKVWTDLRNVAAKCSIELQTCLRQLNEQHDLTESLPIQNLECSVLQVLTNLFISLELAVYHVIRYGKESNADTGNWLPDLRDFCSGLLGVRSTDADFLSSDHLKKGIGEIIQDISSQVRAVQNVLMEVIGPNSGPQDKPSSVSSTRDPAETDDLQSVPANGPLACLRDSISHLLQIQSLHALPFSSLTAGPSDGIEHLPRIISAISGQLTDFSFALEGWASSYEEATRKRAVPVEPEFQQHSLSELNPVDLVSNVLQSFKQYLMLISASLRRPIYSIDDVQERLETHKIIPVDLCWQTMKVVCLCKALQKRVVEPTRHAEITKKIRYLSITSQHVFEETIQWTIHARNLWGRYIQLSQQINKFNALIANLCARLPEYPKKLVPQLYCNPHDWLNAQTENSRKNEKLSLVTTTVRHLLHSSDSTDVLLTQLDWIRGLAVQLRVQDGVAMSLIFRIHRLNHDLVELYQRNGQSCEPEMRSPHDHFSSSPHDEYVTPWTGEFETGWTRLTQWTMNLFVGLFRAISIITSIERSIESLTRWFIPLSLPEDAQLPRNSDPVRNIVILTKDLDKLNQLVLDLSGEEGTLLRKVHLDTLQLTEGIRISNHNGLMLDRLIDREEEMWFKYTSLRAEAERKIRLKYQEIMTLLNISPDGPLNLERQQTEKEVLTHLQKWFKDLLSRVTNVLSDSEVIFTKVGEIERYRSAWVCVNNLITNSLPLLVQLVRKNNDARMTEISNTQLFKQIILRCDHLLQFSELAYFKLSTMLDTWYQIGAHLDTYATEVEQFTCQFSVPILEFGYEQLSDRDGNEYDLGIRLMQIKSTEQRRIQLIQQLFHLRNEARQLTRGKSLIGVLHGAEQMGTEVDIDADETPRAFFIPSSQSSSFLERLSFLHKSLLDTQQCSRVQGSPSLAQKLADSWSQFESLETQFILECDRLAFIHECVSVFQVLPVSQTDIWFDLLSTAVGQLTGCLPDNAELFREEQKDGDCMGNRVLSEGSATYVKLQEFGKYLTDLLEKSESLGRLIKISTQLRLIRSRLMRCSTIHSDFVRRVKEVQEKLREMLDRSRNYAAFHAQDEQILRQCYTNLTEQWDTFKREWNEDLSATESDRHIASRNKMSMPLVRTLMKAQKHHISSLSDWKTSVGLLIPPVPEFTTHCVTDSAIGPHSLSLSPVITFSRFDGAWDQLVARCDEIHNLWIRCEKLSGTLRLSNNCLLVHKHARQNSGEVEDQLLHFPFESEEHSQAHLLWAELLTLKFQLPSPYSGGLVTSDPLSTAHHCEPLSLCKSAIVNSFGEFLDLLTDCIRSIEQLYRFCSNQINPSSRITLAHLFNYRFILSVRDSTNISPADLPKPGFRKKDGSEEAADGSVNRMHDLVTTVLVNGHLLLNRAIQDRIDEDDDLLKLRCLLLDVGNWSMEYHRKLWKLSAAVDGVLDQWFSFVMVGTAIYNDLMEQQCRKLLSSVPMRGGEKTEVKDKYRSIPSVTQGCSIEPEQIVMLMTTWAACDEMFEVGCAMQWIQFNKTDQFNCMESSERNCTDASHSSPWACALGLAKYWSHLRNSTASSISQPENELITPTVGRANAIIQWLDALLAEKLHPSNGHLDFSDKNEMELLCKRLIDVSSLLESTEGELRGISSSSMKQACSICPALSLYTRTCALGVELLNASVQRLLWLIRSSQKLQVRRDKLQSMAQAAAFVIHLDATDLEKELRIDRARIGSTNPFQPSDTSRSVDEYDLRTMEFEIQKKITSLSEQMILLDSLRLRATFALATACHDLPLTRVDWSRLRKLRGEIGMHTASCTDSSEISFLLANSPFVLTILYEQLIMSSQIFESIGRSISYWNVYSA
ncbi:unnamed protein product [Calicophoron daubneyi]|uniref:Uncharacterized protein n=1 Tax=Calicophoron daubneyi TaxID=300641 RepID=A0AAV2TH94_CALDB